MQFVQEAHCKLDLDNAVVSFYDGLVVLALYGKSRNQNVVRSLHSVEIPAATEAIINVSIPKKFRSKTALLEPYTGNTSRPFLVGKTLVSVVRQCAVFWIRLTLAVVFAKVRL